MDFESPRFAGDPVLEEILNDPDTGTKKLQHGSPAGSVTSVQRALWDLWWPNRADPPIEVAAPEGFADGDYGSGTSRTVVAFKRHHDIHFPPDAVTGIVDGFAGPRTLAFLDHNIALFDELEVAINAKFADMSSGASTAGFTRSFPVLGTTAVDRVVSIDFASFHIVAKRGIGAFAVGDPIASSYIFRFHGPAGPFGAPIGDAFDEEPGRRRQEFEFGSLRSPAPGVPAEPVGAEPPPQTNF